MVNLDFEHCTGCGACIQKCPNNCIEWFSAEFGFNYPKINMDKCIECGLCEKVCPVGDIIDQPTNQRIFALVNRDKDVLMNSTSGGAFSSLAESILADDGIVYGCAMTSDFYVRHIRISTKAEISKLRGSKYVQSDTSEVYKQLEKDLKDGKLVLFSGTPCQVAGLNHFLNNNYDNLITVDIICHGIASQSYFDKYVEYLKTEIQNLTLIEFRNKKYVGWSCGGILSTGEKDIPLYNHTHYYYSYYLSGEIYRKSCYSCPYANMNRIGDITLGDFWGAERHSLDMDVSNGCSLVIVNSEKGYKLINSISDGVALSEVGLKAAISGNEQLLHPTMLKQSRKERLLEFDMLSGQEIQTIYKKTHFKKIIIGNIKQLIPYRVKRIIRRFI